MLETIMKGFDWIIEKATDVRDDFGALMYDLQHSNMTKKDLAKIGVTTLIGGSYLAATAGCDRGSSSSSGNTVTPTVSGPDIAWYSSAPGDQEENKGTTFTVDVADPNGIDYVICTYSSGSGDTVLNFTRTAGDEFNGTYEVTNNFGSDEFTFIINAYDLDGRGSSDDGKTLTGGFVRYADPVTGQTRLEGEFEADLVTPKNGLRKSKADGNIDDYFMNDTFDLWHSGLGQNVQVTVTASAYNPGWVAIKYMDENAGSFATEQEALEENLVPLVKIAPMAAKRIPEVVQHLETNGFNDGTYTFNVDLDQVEYTP